MSVPLIVHDARLVDDGRVHEHAWVAVDDGRVVATGTGPGWRELSPRQTYDADDALLTPGFVDLHGHGGGGASYDDGAAAIAVARATHRAHGTTSAVLSLVTAAIDDLAARVATVAELAADDRTILGSHLEGPFLDPGHKGAHQERRLRAPDPAAIDRLLAAGRGTVRQVTLAPELPGGLAAVQRFVAAGVVVAIGHTGADRDLTARAFDAGATLLTHAYNAMPGIGHRAPGPVPAALRDPRVTLELIADGVHVDPDVLALTFAAAPHRIALVTDAMAAAGGPDGRYLLGGLAVEVSDGVARLADGGAIAGSTLTQDVALRLVVERAGVDPVDAVRALTTTPAAAVRTPPGVGSLQVGAPFDAVLLDASWQVSRVWVGGRPV